MSDCKPFVREINYNTEPNSGFPLYFAPFTCFPFPAHGTHNRVAISSYKHQSINTSG